MTQLIKKEFNGNLISFDLTSDMLISLTDIAKANGKLVGHWLALQTAQDYLEEYSSSIAIPMDEIIIVKQGGNGGGTWANQDIALEFARWCSPKFSIWCNKQIKELLTKGAVTLQPALPETYLDALKQLVIKEELNQKLMLESKAQLKEIDHKQDVIVGLVDDVQLADMRAILNRVVRHSGSPQERWRVLYKQFSAVYHCNLGLMSKRKDCSKLEYIDKHLAKLPELFRMSCRLFEMDTKQVQLDMFGVVKY